MQSRAAIRSGVNHFLLHSTAGAAAFNSSRRALTSSEDTEKREFQAETRMLLDIVAKSLYSEKEVFIRELISNASDALEKLRYIQLQEQGAAASADAEGEEGGSHQKALEIQLITDPKNRTLTIQDSGIGMTREEMISNLGTIARSGSKEFLKNLQDKGASAAESIIGQFGVGFYSAFMVANKVEVFTKSYQPDSPGLKWTSDGSGSYEISQVDGNSVEQGTKIVMHLKTGDDAEFAEEKNVQAIIERYSNFVSSPIFLNGNQVNKLSALWTLPPKEIKKEQHDEFYKFISHGIEHDRPRYTIHYATDAPVNIRALLYIPTVKPNLLELAHGQNDVKVSLYSRRVLIQNKAKDILPNWLRFMKGVVDSEDIPLNLSRELLQQSALIRKIRDVIGNRVIKFLLDQQKKEPERYDEFYKDFSIYLKEAIISSTDQNEKENISKLLTFETSGRRKGVKTTLQEYCTRLQKDQKDIYYLCTPSRELAESSPYFEAMKEENLEILFCYEPYDEVVMMQLGQFDRKNMISVEKKLSNSKSDTDADLGDMTKREADNLLEWIQSTLGSKKVANIKITSRLRDHPCIISVGGGAEMGAARQFVKTQHDLTQDQKYMLLQPTVEVNPKHPIMTNLSQLRKTDSELAENVLQQVYDNAMVAAGLLDDARPMVNRLNTVLGDLMRKAVTAKDTILRP